MHGTHIGRAHRAPPSGRKNAVTRLNYRPIKVALGTLAAGACAVWAWRHEARPTPVASPWMEARIAAVATPLMPEPASTAPAPKPSVTVDDEPDPPRARFVRTFDAASFRRGNLHAHSNRSDGDSSPAEVYSWYRSHGYHFIAVTDHNTFTNPTEFVTEPEADFLVLGGEEVTMRGAGREVHMNALCNRRVVPGGTFASAREALAHGVLEIRTAGGIALINHPNFTWGVKASDLAAAAGSNLLEIYSGHPFVPSDGRPGTPSHETMWDIALTEGLDYMGVAVDDMHRLRPDRRRVSRPGKSLGRSLCREARRADHLPGARERDALFIDRPVVATRARDRRDICRVADRSQRGGDLHRIGRPCARQTAPGRARFVGVVRRGGNGGVRARADRAAGWQSRVDSGRSRAGAEPRPHGQRIVAAYPPAGVSAHSVPHAEPTFRRVPSRPSLRRSRRERAMVRDETGSWALVVLPVVGALLGCQPRPAAPRAGTMGTEVLASASGVDGPLWSAAREGTTGFLRDLEDLVRIDSGTEDAEGLAQVGTLLAQRLRDLGAAVEVLAAAPSKGPVVRGTFRGRGSARIMMMVHFDTVFAKGEATKRPFRVVGNKAFGPGVADAKGGIAVILGALRIVHQRGFDRYKTLTVLFNSDEETGSLGSHAMIESVAAEHDYVMSYEPPDKERVIVATNGVAYVHLRVAGRAAHAGAAPEKGRNAAVELAHQITQLRDLGDAARGTTVNWTRLESGDRINIIPDHAEATADMRMSDPAEVSRVQKVANDRIGKRLVPDTEVTVTVEPRRPPFSRNAPTDRLAALAGRVYRELGKSLEPVAMRYGTDAGFAYRAGSETPAVLEGLGVVGDGLHTDQEWADLDSVAPRLYLTVRLLELLGTPAGH